MMDPLGDPDEEKYRSIKKEVKVSKVLKKISYTQLRYLCQTCRTVYSSIYKFLQAEERDEKMRKSWVEVGKDVGLVVVEDDDVEQEDEDREVEKIIAKGKEAKRKLATGMYRFNVKLVEQHCTVQYSACNNKL